MIPIVDLNAPDLGDLSAACREWGLFHLAGHSIDPTLIDASLAQASNFFALPPATKQRIRRTATNSWGYNDAELTKNRTDWKEILDIGPTVTTGPLAGSSPQWPDSPAFRETLEALYDAMHETAIAVLGLINRSLEIEVDFEAAFADHSSFMRLNFYPQCPEPARDSTTLDASDGHLGIHHHTDAGAVTVLVQDGKPGLQVFDGQRWTDAQAPAGTITINIGDIAQVWSNDHYRAPLHRVVAHTDATRISIPYFLNPAYTYDYAPLVRGESARYTSINWGEFRGKRSAGDYANLGEEVQIGDYRLP